MPNSKEVNVLHESGFRVGLYKPTLNPHSGYTVTVSFEGTRLSSFSFGDKRQAAFVQSAIATVIRDVVACLKQEQKEAPPKSLPFGNVDEDDQA